MESVLLEHLDEDEDDEEEVEEEQEEEECMYLFSTPRTGFETRSFFMWNTSCLN